MVKWRKATIKTNKINHTSLFKKKVNIISIQGHVRKTNYLAFQMSSEFWDLKYVDVSLIVFCSIVNSLYLSYLITKKLKVHVYILESFYSRRFLYGFFKRTPFSTPNQIPHASKKKSPVLGICNLLLNCWIMDFHRFPSITGYCQVSWFSSETYRKTIYMNHRTCRNETHTHLEYSSIPTNIYNVRRCYLHYWKRRTIINYSHLWTLGATIMIDLTRYFHWHNSSIIVMGVTNCLGSTDSSSVTCSQERTRRK